MGDLEKDFTKIFVIVFVITIVIFIFLSVLEYHFINDKQIGQETTQEMPLE